MTNLTRLAVAVQAVSLLVLSAASGPLHAQARERTLYVSVTDDAGTPVSQLEPGDLIVQEDGVRREVLRVLPADDPIDIALLVDNSAAGADHLTALRGGLLRFAELMHATNPIALIGLADRPTVLTDYTTSLPALRTGIGRVFPQPGSGMTLLDALVEVSRGLTRRENRRAALVAVFGDGPELGRFDDRSVLEAVDEAGASFHAVTVGTFTSFAPEELRYRALVLSQGPARTGGRHDSLLVATAIPGALERIARELSSQFKVVYARPASLIPPDTITVDSARPGLTARGTPARGEGE